MTRSPATTPYSREYYASLQRTSLQSAREVIPLVRQYHDPASVVDVGCGGGSWLSVFHELGVRDIYGLDGDWAKTDDLLIPSALFQETDFSKPFRLPRTFDLVVCLEIAEHIHKPSAPVLIESLTHLGPVVLFSAAIPGQGGVDHVNEQWPEYWARLFADFGFVPADCLRRHLWSNAAVEFWYGQNIVFYVKESWLSNVPKLALERSAGPPLSLVHPKLFLEERGEELVNLKEWVAELQAEETRLWALIDEREERIAEKEQHIRDLEDCKPGTVPLRKVLRSLPALVKHALRNRTRRI